MPLYKDNSSSTFLKSSITLICKWTINLPLPGPLSSVATFIIHTKTHASLLGTWQCHLPEGKKKSVFLKSLCPGPLLLAGDSPLCPLDLVFSLWLPLSTVTVFYQPVIMPAILDGLCVCTDAAFENRTVLPSLVSRHGQIGDPGLHPLNKRQCCSSLGKISVSAEVGKQYKCSSSPEGTFLSFLLQKDS